MTSETINLEKFSEKANQELCLALIKTESEDDVVNIIKPFLDDESLWQPLGEREGNYNTAGNQQSDSIAALVENIVNSCDAILIGRCLREGHDPTSSEAPQSMSEAMLRYFGIKDGNPNSITSEDRKKLASNIGLVSTGDKRLPTIACFDKGSGQNSTNFKKTFLSLPGSEKTTSKSGIPFVQGLFNMGGTGVLPFCGDPKKDYNFKLIVSKKDPTLSDADGNWGFTIIRRMPPQKKHTSSTFVYLAPREKILTFKTDKLLVLPGKYPNAYGEPLEWGSYVKLYNYQLSKPSILVLETLYEIGHHLFRPAIPLTIYERRTGYESSHTLTNFMHGDVVRLTQNKNKIMEKDFPQTFPINIPDLESELLVTIYVLKSSERDKKWLGAHGNHRVIFTINGQMHESKKKEFLTTEKVDKAYLADDIMVEVNCDNISDLAREKMFMPSRDRIRKNEIKLNVEQQLQDLLKNHQGLIELNDSRRADELEEARSNKKPLTSLINKLIKRSHAFSLLFNYGVEIDQPYDFKWKKVKRKPYEPNYFPEFFRLKPERKVFEIQPNKGTSIYIENDAPNDYFTRENDKGRGPYVAPRRFNYHYSLWNGMMRLYLKPKSNLKPGTELPVEISIKDKSKDEPFSLKFKLKIIPKKEPTEPKPKELWDLETVYEQNDKVHWKENLWISLQHGNSGNQPDITPEWWSKKEKIEISKNYGRKKIEIDGGKPQPMKALPPHTFVHKDDDKWIRYKFDDGTGAYLIPSGDTFDFFISLGNKYYEDELSNAKSGEHELLQEQYAWGIMLESLAMIHEIKQKQPEYDSNKIAEIVTLASRGIAMSIIPTIKELSKNILR